jgi:hypothetical protein
MKVFAQYLGLVVNDYLEKDKTNKLPLETCDFVFVAPRIFGYNMTESEIHTIFTEAGLLLNDNQKVTIFNDLDVHMDIIQYRLEIGESIVCLFYTFYLFSDLTMHHTVDAFFSDTFGDRELPGLTINKIKPVNCQTLPSIPDIIHVGPLYESFEDYIGDKVDTSIDIIERCLNLVLLCLKV